MGKKISIGQYARKVAKMGPEMEAAAIRGVQSAAYWLEGEAVDQLKGTRPYPPEDTGELVRSAKTTLIDRGAIVSFDAPHAAFIEYGTRPHMPPLQPLMDWAIRKGLADTEEEAKAVAWKIAQKIKREGTTPKFFLARAVKQLSRRRIVSREIKAELKEAGLEVVTFSRKKPTS